MCLLLCSRTLGGEGIHLNQQLGGGFNHVLFSPKKPGEDVQV